MTTLKISSFVAAVLIIAACHSTKKTTSTASTDPPPVPPTAPVLISPKPSNGVFAPGNEQLAAIQVKHPDATLAVLTEGHSLYVGTCTGCHGSKSIYRIPEDKWQEIIDDMAPKARLTAPQKDALTRYIFSIKATQPK